MMKLSCNNSIRRLSIYSLLLLLGGCSTMMAAYDLSSCSERGGEVVFKCVAWDPFNLSYCQRSENICVGSMTHAQLEELKNPGVYVPPPELSEDEKARKKMQRWEESLNKYATRKNLREDTDKYPKLSWLSSKWCLKDSGSKIPANYYNVSQTGIGSLSINYNDIDVNFKHFTHVEIIGNYYDLWDGSGYSLDLEAEHGRRLEKHSDEEFSLVYKFKSKSGYRIPGSWSDKEVGEYAKARALEIGPAQHIKNPEVYVKC